MALTKQQELSGFGQKIYTLDDLIRISKGKYLTKFDPRYNDYYFLCLNPDSPRLYIQYISKDTINYKVKNKLTRHYIVGPTGYNIKAKILDQIIADSETS